MSEIGIKGVDVNVPGNWMNIQIQRGTLQIFILIRKGGIWGAASEDHGDSGPFYSVIYKLGKVNLLNKERPFIVYDTIRVAKDVSGFKIEALSGPCKNINSSHSFGTEDEIYGGVWRPIFIKQNR